MKNVNNYSPGFLKYKKKKRNQTIAIHITQISILVLLIGLWELLAQLNVIDTFILSCPSNMCKTIGTLWKDGSLLMHIGTTLYEALLGFVIATGIGTVVAILLWWNETIYRILDPYIIVLNSLPKIALGPILIIWVGVGTKAIVAMDVYTRANVADTGQSGTEGFAERKIVKSYNKSNHKNNHYITTDKCQY